MVWRELLWGRSTREVTTRAMEVSCNAYFAQVSLDVGWNQLKKTGEAFGFNKDFLFSDLKTSKSQLPITSQTDAEELAWSGVGQGRVLVTSIHMAMIASTIANGGAIPEPRLIYGIQTRTGKVRMHNNNLNSPFRPWKLSLSACDGWCAGTAPVSSTVHRGMTAGKTGTAEVDRENSLMLGLSALHPLKSQPCVSVVLKTFLNRGTKLLGGVNFTVLRARYRGVWFCWRHGKQIESSAWTPWCVYYERSRWGNYIYIEKWFL